METPLVRLAQGLRTIVRRRGAAYLGYLASGVAWPKAAYRFGWGPRSPALLRSIFAATAVFASAPLDEAQERELLATSADIEALMDRAHRAGITGLSRAFDHVVRMPHGDVRFARLPGARHHRRRGVLFAAERDRDRLAFNERFGASILTEASARQLLRERKGAVPAGYRDYAPIDFSGGLTIGQFLSTDSGTGRWDFFNGRLVAPIVRGQRVLDLGSNNASMPLMMLRAGARSMTGIEFTPEIADFARLNARILAWRDIRPYDIRILTGDMRLFLSEDLGTLDVVTAFCSLYYLPEEDMARVIRKAAAMGACLILQANDAIDNLPARTSDLHRLMTANGYSTVEIHESPGFARPLLIGRAPIAAPRVPHAQRVLMEV